MTLGAEEVSPTTLCHESILFIREPSFLVVEMFFGWRRINPQFLGQLTSNLPENPL